MQIHELVRFSKENCFNGAVQTEWFYDINRVKSVVESYVFHGTGNVCAPEKRPVSHRKADRINLDFI